MSASPERQDAQPEVKPENQHVSLRIQGAGFPELLIKVKKTTKLQKMMNAYCERVGKTLREIRFLFDGHKLQGEQTVADLDIDDEDDEVVIDVVQEAASSGVRLPPMPASPERQDARAQVNPQVKSVSLRVTGVSMPELLIKVKTTTKLGKMMRAYAERANKNPDDIRFMLDGVRLNADHTVYDLDLDDGDGEEIMIEVVQEAFGGC
ncbi:hypothetical protein ACM66B_002353 [Microbotryomycetes sp. NB124-2]